MQHYDDSKTYSPVMSTPTKAHPIGISTPGPLKGTPIFRVATPSGGYVYNPFHRQFLKGLTDFTVCSPGLFSQTEEGVESAPRPNGDLSPDIRGDLFPEDIDDNPVGQFKLQDHINDHYDEIAQSHIDSFFQSNVIAPSPSLHEGKHHSNQTPRYSRTNNGNKNDDHTPKGRNGRKKNKAVMMADVEQQTAISLPPDFDLVSLLASLTNASGDDLGAPSSSSEEPLLCECLAIRGEPYPHAGLFLCMACRESSNLGCYSRRSLFVEPLDVINDNSADMSADNSRNAGGIFGVPLGDISLEQCTEEGLDEDGLAAPRSPFAPSFCFDFTPSSPCVDGRLSPGTSYPFSPPDGACSFALHGVNRPPRLLASPEFSPIGSPICSSIEDEQEEPPTPEDTLPAGISFIENNESSQQYQNSFQGNIGRPLIEDMSQSTTSFVISYPNDVFIGEEENVSMLEDLRQ